MFLALITTTNAQLTKKSCIRATYIPKMFCLIYRNTIDQVSVPFLAGWFNESSKR